ncbi:RNA polymerase II elongation factor ELL-like isoform X2 [Dysidea avara]|uniref:RNA polymerase II elongation factor ELL-like isoform X2 n=1 Tax=Dysidea avara TaxID=196820 RepID=UPI00331E064B
MAQRAAVNLSDLPEGDHLVKDGSYHGTCVVYMKLTEACVKAIDTLLAKKGANDCGLCVSFNTAGGTFNVPAVANSEAKAFEFQTNKIEKGSIECLHQHRQIQGSRQADHSLSSLGSIHHRLSIKATDEVYETTKTKALEAEEERKDSHRVKHIDKLPSSRTPWKLKNRLEATNSHQPKPSKKPEETLTSSNSANIIIRDRVIHFLALKPHRKVDLHNRLKKDKSCENSLNHLDPVLTQVAELQSGTAVYILKPSFYPLVKVDTFPKYSESERQVVRRNLQQAGIKVASASSGVKRVAEDVPNVTKRAKSSHTTMKHTKPVEVTPESNALPKKSEATTSEEATTKVTDIVMQDKKHKKKKKHKHSKDQDVAQQSVVTEPPTSQQSEQPPVDGDDFSQFTIITNHEQRAKYKEEFNADYNKYLELKARTDEVTCEFNKLKDQLAECPKKSEEYKRLSRSIKKKYMEKQNDAVYQQEKKQYQQLCMKLSHIKKLVIEYDNSCASSNS